MDGPIQDDDAAAIDPLVPGYPSPTWVPEWAFDQARESLQRFPREEGLLGPENDDTGVDFDGVLLEREAKIRVTWNRFASLRDRSWLRNLCLACYRRYKKFEAEKRIEEVVSLAELPIIPLADRRQEKVYWQLPTVGHGDHRRYYFERFDLMPIEFGARLFLSLSAAHDPNEFGYPERLAFDLERSSIWTDIGPLQDGPDGPMRRLEFSKQTLCDLVQAQRLLDDMVDVSEYRKEQSPPTKDGPVEETQDFILGGKVIPKLPMMQWQVLTAVWQGYGKQKDVLEFVEIRQENSKKTLSEDKTSPEGCREWAGHYIGKINRRIIKHGYRLSERRQNDSRVSRSVIYLQRLPVDPED